MTKRKFGHWELYKEEDFEFVRQQCAEYERLHPKRLTSLPLDTPLDNSLLSVFTFMDLLKRIDIEYWPFLVQLNKTTAKLFSENGCSSPYRLALDYLISHSCQILPLQLSEEFPFNHPSKLIHMLLGADEKLALYSNMNRVEYTPVMEHLIGLYFYIASSCLSPIFQHYEVLFSETKTRHNRVRRKAFLVRSGQQGLLNWGDDPERRNTILLNRRGFQWLSPQGELFGSHSLTLKRLARLGKQLAKGLLHQNTALQYFWRSDSSPFTTRYVRSQRWINVQ